MIKAERPLTPEMRRALIDGMARQNDVGFVRGEELRISDADMDAMEDAGWLKRMNDLPHTRRCYQVTQLGAAQVIPADVREILRDPEELKADERLTLYPHPDNDSLLLGSNGHCYAASRPPGRAGWQHELAYQVLDRLRPDVLPVNVRMLLGGLFASVVEDVAQKVTRK